MASLTRARSMNVEAPPEVVMTALVREIEAISPETHRASPGAIMINFSVGPAAAASAGIYVSPVGLDWETGEETPWTDWNRTEMYVTARIAGDDVAESDGPEADIFFDQIHGAVDRAVEIVLARQQQAAAAELA